MVSKKALAIPPLAAVVIMPGGFVEGVVEVLRQYSLLVLIILVSLLVGNAFIGYYSRKLEAHTYLGETGISIAALLITLLMLDMTGIFTFPGNYFFLIVYILFFALVGFTLAHLTHYMIVYRRGKIGAPGMPIPPNPPEYSPMREIKETVLAPSRHEMEEKLIIADVEPMALPKKAEAPPRPMPPAEIQAGRVEVEQKRREVQTLIETAPPAKREKIRKTAELMDALESQIEAQRIVQQPVIVVKEAQPKVVVKEVQPKIVVQRVEAKPAPSGGLSSDLQELKRSLEEIRNGMGDLQGELHQHVAKRLLGRELKDWESVSDARVQEQIFDKMLGEEEAKKKSAAKKKKGKAKKKKAKPKTKPKK